MKKWNSGRLTTKVYWTTAIGFLGFVTLFMVLQLVFFQPYSLKVRSSELESDFRGMYEELQDQPLNEQWMNKLADFDVAHYSLTGVVHKQGKLVDVYLGTRELKASPLTKAQIGEPMEVQLIMADPWQKVTPAVPVTPTEPIDTENPQKAVPMRTVAAVSWYSQDAMRLNDLLQEKLAEMLLRPMDQGITSQLFNQGVGVDSNKERVWAAMAPLPPEKGQERYLVTVSTLEPVSDATALLGGFYRYFYIAAVIMMMGFAFLFSRMISNPLVKLNHAAKRLAKLDFSVRTDMKREDEIGELAQTFDYLATELHDTMGELQEANDQLQLDIEKEKQLERMRKRFVANVSHELKTPISLIQGYAEALRDNVGQGAKRDKYATVIIHESERMSRLVNDLLDLSQLESGKFRLQWSAIPLREHIRFVVGTLEQIANDRMIQLEWLCSEVEVLVRSDAQRLQQILTNVLTNAIRYTGAGDRIQITVRPVSGPAEGCELPGSLDGVSIVSWVQVSIFNSGIPIAEEHLPYIWDAFYRPDESGIRGDTGNGIGLSIVKHLLEMHGSMYSIGNVEGGVEVTFMLPVMPRSEA
ncbi:sensor histidine kinase [Paenibacillus terrigena]|uniref:sensor histidine kinase n=1 Tax=Paenibacillus terrigena TaxID=369333 RepID=UPI000373C3D6|nr:histidine kinase dimerization/phospho-acceptor domain-containing protein [Paenibacillus terrigena]